MKRFIIACLLFTSLFANRETCPIPPTTVAIEPLGLLAGCVDVATGAYIGSTVELTVNCHEPIGLYRHLISCSEGEGSTSFWQLGKEYLDFKAKRHAKKEESRFRIIGEAGDIIEYVVDGAFRDWGFHQRGIPFFLHVSPDQPLVNSSLSGRTHPLNNSLRYSAVSPEHAHYGSDAFTLNKGSGEIRVYTHGRKRWSDYHRWNKGDNRAPKQETFLLREVIRPNGNRIFYVYDGNDELIEMRSANKGDSQTFGWIRIQHETGEKIVTTSDGQRVQIQTATIADPSNSKKKKEILRTISHSDGIVESFTYASDKKHLELEVRGVHRQGLLKLGYADCQIPGQHFHEVEPNRGAFEDFIVKHRSLKTLCAPVGNWGAFEPLYILHPALSIHFRQKLCGSVRVDIPGGHLVYTISEGSVCSVGRCIGENQGIGSVSHRRFKGDLTSRTIFGGNPVFSSESFSYDGQHNVIDRRLYAKLTGRPQRPEQREFSKVTYTYSKDGFNLPLFEEQGPLRTVNEYRPGTDLLILRRIYERGELREETAFEYDHNAALISKIHKIGSLTLIEETKRREDGLPLEITEKTPFNQLKRTVFHYNQRNQVIQTDHFDAEGHHRYSLFTEFDDRSRVISQTDALGRKTQLTYNEFNLPITTHVEGTNQELHFEYDHLHRLVKKELHNPITGENQVESYQFNKMSHQVGFITPLGHLVVFQRDPYGRALAEEQEKVRTLEGWKSPKIVREYDGCDRVIKEIDPLGGVTEIRYTDRGDWDFKKYPDGTSEKRYFTLEGQLEEETHQDGSSTFYTRDYKGRVLSQERRAPSGEIVAQESFTYDGDLLLSHTDPLGFTTHYAYDDAGRLLSTRREDALTEFIYDALGRKVGESSWVDDSHYLLKRFDYDLLNRIIAEQLEDETGKVYQRKETTHDLSGNPIQVSTLLATTTTDYDYLNRPIRKVDPLGRITTIAYAHVLFEGHNALLITTTDPLGRQTLLYQEGRGLPLRKERKDEKGNLLSQVDHFYDLNGNEVKQEHQVLSEGKLLRTYAFGHTFGPGNLLLQSTEGLTSELPRITRYLYDRYRRLNCTIKPDGAHLHRTYDSIGRLATHTGPDFSYSYTYDAADRLIAVNDIKRTYDAHHRLLFESGPAGSVAYTRDRLGRKTHLHYLAQEVSYTYQGPYLSTISCYDLAHRYLEYDLEGRPTLEELPGRCGLRKKSYDPLGRLTHLETDYLVQDLSYDLASRLIHLKTASLYHEWEEKEEHFSYDSLDQLTSEPDKIYAHDSIGNRLADNGRSYEYDGHNQRRNDSYDLCGRLLQAGPHRCSYDSLDRLTRLDSRSLAYDAFHRREDLLYDDQVELGDLDHLRILSHTSSGSIGAMVLVILEDQPYIPLTDHLGSVIGLVNPQGQLCERYLYSAFGIPGEESIYDNPWGFCSKRREGELFLFGRRYYHPESGRWVSPDPLGHADGPNLYAYCHNNPLGWVDPMGLLDLSIKEVMGNVKDCFSAFGRGIFEWDQADRLPPEVFLRDPKLDPKVIEERTTRLDGALQIVAGCWETSIGVGVAAIPGGAFIGNLLIIDGVSRAAAGTMDLCTGTRATPLFEQGLQMGGCSSGVASNISNVVLSLGLFADGMAVAERLAASIAARSSTRVSVGLSREMGGVESLAAQEVRGSNGYFGHRGFELEPPTPFSRPRNPSTTVHGRTYSRHAVDQMQNRGFTPSVAEEIIKKGTVEVGKKPGTIAYYDVVNHATVILNENGEVVTVSHGYIRQ
ncbi:MAG: RHS repeat-associated core domain-containing protein [Verrucomicrobia bacterium]|nr:RHS repeat-associated core domain-containing protein [Verrucomicrobiota bacterium]